MSSHVDVIVIGFGPAGEMLASLLGQRGAAVAVLEKFSEPYGLPRMSTLDGEIARLLQHAADPKEALAESVPELSVELWGADAQQKGFFDWNYKRAGHMSHLSTHQPNIESAMERRIAEHPNVQVYWGREVVELVDNGVDYTVRAVDRTTAAQEPIEVTAQYVVGMDGANSFVRRAIGVDLEVLHTHNDRWILTDYDVIEPLPNNLEHRIYFDLDLDQPYFWGPNGVGRVRTDVRLRPDDDAALESDDADGYEFLENRVGVPRTSVKQTRRKMYTFRSQIATAMRRGNVFIGGDAAHAMPPYMGQGACTAMRDAANLAWKLDLVLRGMVDSSVLDSYEAERLTHSRFFVEGSLAAYKMVNPANHQEAAERDAYLEAHRGDVTPPIPPLREGIQHRHDDGEYAPQAGAVAPQGRVSVDGRENLLDDVVGYGFHLVSIQPIKTILGEERCARLVHLGTSLVEVGGVDGFEDLDGTYAEYFAMHQATALLSRPDGYIFGIANGPENTVALVDSLLAQLPRPVAAVA
ncbi:bifunctional 3-(3-hydroxy-phenyl)propionate/3-hydroxycinnamic acid hydroxylase [Mycolicibacterium bacteremicum]|uniref:bifunctional 3-(3-hydroxy-phenyl)propionate/3-hydroxycinnamic acid hydroxylase n=1 Tax=Mycolicibacterium bacteremicum TaxID=564198 RepID=UPI0026EEBE78|nr:bifunctional 3-(3-hydroxy-phenyl)propionate/3-hydroxycinnamic acid hydroxylase [Mycolicibacterium bacteremicum]